MKLDIDIDADQHLKLPKKEDASGQLLNESNEVASQGVTPKLQVGGKTPIAKPARGLLSNSKLGGGDDSSSLWM